MPETSFNPLPQVTHSENQFIDYRNYWWNKGFVELMAKRLRLNKHQSLLDVGCGQCHWSRLLTPFLKKPAYVAGVDKDVKWASGSPELQRFFEEQGCWFEAKEGDTLALPFPDNSFDMVTCQTVLIHVSNPARAIAEMRRVLKPGGTILCAEPNNRIQSLIKNSLSEYDTIDNTLDHVKYALIVEEGKKRLGYGDNSVGDLLPQLLSVEGFSQIDVKLSDKAIAMIPPYATREQKATKKYWKQGGPEDAMSHSDLFYFEAFGDEHLDFYHDYQAKYAEHGSHIFDGLTQHTFYSAGATLMYVVSGTKE